MGFLDKLFGRKQDKQQRATAVAEPPPEVAVDCPHAVLTPRWDNAADMGKHDLVSTYVCEACGASFSREKGEALGASAAERLHLGEEKTQL